MRAHKPRMLVLGDVSQAAGTRRIGPLVTKNEDYRTPLPTARSAPDQPRDPPSITSSPISPRNQISIGQNDTIHLMDQRSLGRATARRDARRVLCPRIATLAPIPGPAHGPAAYGRVEGPCLEPPPRHTPCWARRTGKRPHREGLARGHELSGEKSIRMKGPQISTGRDRSVTVTIFPKVSFEHGTHTETFLSRNLSQRRQTC